jgi:hypothetical protein
MLSCDRGAHGALLDYFRLGGEERKEYEVKFRVQEHSEDCARLIEQFS